MSTNIPIKYENGRFDEGTNGLPVCSQIFRSRAGGSVRACLTINTPGGPYNVHSMYLRMDMLMREYAVHADYANIHKYPDADLIHNILI